MLLSGLFSSRRLSENYGGHLQIRDREGGWDARFYTDRAQLSQL